MSTALITDGAAIDELASRLGTTDCIGLDTEFMRERTYRPQLCLLQVALPDGICFVDPLAGTGLAPLAAALQAPGTTKILHAARQDLEALWPLCGDLTNVFDTQVAAALAGMPAQIGYGKLVGELLGVHLAKSQTRTDWSRRPLSDAQLDYAAGDVAHLHALREALLARLQSLGRLSWLEEELARLAAPGHLFVQPDQAWERLRWAADLDEDRLRLLRLLAAWRERRAAAKNRPRTWILDDPGLHALVLQAPRSEAALAQLEVLPAGFITHSAAAVLEVVEAARLPARLPAPAPRRKPDAAHLAQMKRLRKVVQDTATALSISPEVLATRRDLALLAGGATQAQVLRGWRREVIGQPLLAAL